MHAHHLGSFVFAAYDTHAHPTEVQPGVVRGNERPGEVLGVGAEDARVGTVIRLGKS